MTYLWVIRQSGWLADTCMPSVPQRNILFIQAYWYQALKLCKHVPCLPLDEWANLYETLHKHCLAILQCIHTPYSNDVHLWHKTESLHFYSLQAKTLLSLYICFHLKGKFMATLDCVLLVLLFITYLKKQCLQKRKRKMQMGNYMAVLRTPLWVVRMKIRTRDLQL